MRADVIFNAVGFKSPAQAPSPVFLFEIIDFGNIFRILQEAGLRDGGQAAAENCQFHELILFYRWE